MLTGFGERLSFRTIESYERDLRLWIEYQGVMAAGKVTAQELRAYLSYLLTEYIPRRLTVGNDIKLSQKTVRNVWITLSAFFHWMSDEFQLRLPVPQDRDPFRQVRSVAGARPGRGRTRQK